MRTNYIPITTEKNDLLIGMANDPHILSFNPGSKKRL